jgi:hypothetical protein
MKSGYLPPNHEMLPQQAQTSDQSLLLKTDKVSIEGLEDEDGGHLPSAKMLFCRNDSKSARGVDGVMREYGCDGSRLNFVMY